MAKTGALMMVAVALTVAFAMPASAVTRSKTAKHWQERAARTQTVYTTFGRRTCGWNRGSTKPQVFLRQQARGCF